jgi:hypothetical protein
MDFLLYLAVPLFVVGIGIFLLRSDQSRRYIGAVSNRTLGLLAIGVGAVDLVVRVLRMTVLR